MGGVFGDGALLALTLSGGNDAGKEVDGILVLVRFGFDPYIAFSELLKAIPDMAATPLLFKLPRGKPVMRFLGGWQVAEGEAETFSY